MNAKQTVVGTTALAIGALLFMFACLMDGLETHAAKMAALSDVGAPAEAVRVNVCAPPGCTLAPGFVDRVREDPEGLVKMVAANKAGVVTFENSAPPATISDQNGALFLGSPSHKICLGDGDCISSFNELRQPRPCPAADPPPPQIRTVEVVRYRWPLAVEWGVIALSIAGAIRLMARVLLRWGARLGLR